MKNFAEVPLKNIDLTDIRWYYKLPAVFIESYKSKYLYNQSFSNVNSVVQHLENCMQANLSLFVSYEEALAMTFGFLPEDEHLIADNEKNRMIRWLKSAMKEVGYNDAAQQTGGLKYAVTIANTIKLNFDKKLDWLRTVQVLRTSICLKNLDIAMQALKDIINMQDQELQPIKIERQAYILSLQIAYCMQLILYIENRLSILQKPFYSDEQFCVDKMNEMLGMAEVCLADSLEKLKALPELSQQAQQECHAMSYLRSFLKRGRSNAKVVDINEGKKAKLIT